MPMVSGMIAAGTPMADPISNRVTGMNRISMMMNGVARTPSTMVERMRYRHGDGSMPRGALTTSKTASGRPTRKAIAAETLTMVSVCRKACRNFSRIGWNIADDLRYLRCVFCIFCIFCVEGWRGMPCAGNGNEQASVQIALHVFHVAMHYLRARPDQRVQIIQVQLTGLADGIAQADHGPVCARRRRRQ